MRIDFHLHTTLSDGALPPRELLAAVRRERVECWAVTDHDTLAGFQVLRGEPGLLPGVEVTAESDHREVHLIALGVDPDDAAFASFLAGIRAVRVERMQALIHHLGITERLAVDDLRRDGAESVSRSHLAQALVRIGRAASIRDVFADLIGDAQVTTLGLTAYPTPAAASAAIRAAGGVVILAHPGHYGDLALIEQLLAHCDGLEVNHPNLDPTVAEALKALADRCGKFASCGSDLHYLGARRPGDRRLPRATLAPLLARLGVARI